MTLKHRAKISQISVAGTRDPHHTRSTVHTFNQDFDANTLKELLGVEMLISACADCMLNMYDVAVRKKKEGRLYICSKCTQTHLG